MRTGGEGRAGANEELLDAVGQGVLAKFGCFLRRDGRREPCVARPQNRQLVGHRVLVEGPDVGL